MKRRKADFTKSRRKAKNLRDRSQDQVTEMLKLCLQKVCELQADLERTEDALDPESAGYAACAMETFRFLESQGLSQDHPVVKSLQERLLQKPDE